MGGGVNNRCYRVLRGVLGLDNVGEGGGFGMKDVRRIRSIISLRFE